MDDYIELFDTGHYHSIVKKNLLIRKLNLSLGELLDFKTTGNVFLVFLYKGTATLKYKQRVQNLKPGCYIAGQIYRENVQICTYENTEFILTELNPVALSHALRKPLVYYTDKFTSINFLGIGVLLKEISESNDDKLKIKLINSFLKSQLPFAKIISDDVFILTKWIDDQNEKIKVDQLGEYLNCGERQVERIFQKKIGVNPKFYLKCVQMRQIINMVMDKGDKPLLDILFERGHYDAPHFNKDFKRIMNMTPLEFLREEPTFVKQILRIKKFR